jgi:hypothetical protein
MAVIYDGHVYNSIPLEPLPHSELATFGSLIWMHRTQQLN